jgi:hypothetical protein
MSIFARNTWLPSWYFPSRIAQKSFRFSSALRSRHGESLPGSVNVPRAAAICSALWLST